MRYAVVASSGVWRSLVARFVRDEEAVGSNPATPTPPPRPKEPALAQRMHISGESAGTIAQALGVSRATVYRVLAERNDQ